MKKFPITVIIPVRNEEKNLPQCLPLLSNFDEIIVVDSQSTDKTTEIVKSFGYKLVEFEWNGKFPKKRNWALRNIPIRNEWVLFLDADEFLTPSFIQSLKSEFQDTKNYVGYWLLYNNYFMGKFLRHGDPIKKLALFKKSAGEYERIEADEEDEKWNYAGIELHEQPILNGQVGIIKGRIDHKENRGLEAYISKHNEFSTWEARRFLREHLKTRQYASFRQKVKYRLIDSWLLPPLYFFYIYYIKLGFLDGKAGYIYAKLKKQYFFNIKAKINELRSQF